jgi:peptide/nickel transport system substrate-binding protein
MKKRAFASLAATAIGATLVIASIGSGAASASSQAGQQASARGGTLRVDSRSDFDYVDPALAYFSHSWQMEFATQLKLMNFPDADGAAGTRLRPEAAAGFPIVSNGGRTYTFRIKKGFRFSNGTPVTASNFAYAILRSLNPRMQSPAASFVEDIVGAKAVIAGKASKAAGIRVSGDRLVITLTKVAPDFLARISMPFFSAVPTGTPVQPNGVQAPLVSAGPYYVKQWVQGRTALAARNPYWNRNKEPWKSLRRPANVDAIEWTFGNSLDATKLRIDKNDADLGNIPPAAVAQLVQQYGINKSRFFVRKNLVMWYLAMNTSRGVFRANAALRKAVNWAIDRPQIVRQHGFLGGGRTDQILPPGMPGYRDWNVYPLKGVNSTSLNVAKRLAKGHTRDGKVVFYAFNTQPGPQIAQVVQFNLKQIGLDVDIKLFDRVVQHDKVGTRGEVFDISHSGWSADYPDPYDFVNILLDGANIQATNNVNESYFNDPSFNKRMQAAARMSGDARLRAYSALDRDITKNAAPLATYINTNSRLYVSPSVGCFNFQPVYTTVNLVATCKK